MAVPENRCRAYPYRNTGRLAAHLSRRAPLVQWLCICFRFGIARFGRAVESEIPFGSLPAFAAHSLRMHGRRAQCVLPLRRVARIAIYYGCADTVTGLAFGYVPEIIEFTKRTSII